MQALLEHFVSRDAMNIAGIGPAFIKTLLDGELVKGPEDLYRLSRPRVMNTVSQKVFDAIEASKTRPIANAIYALGIPHVGRTVAAKLAKHFGSIDAIFGADWHAVAALTGYAVANAIHLFWNDPDESNMVGGLRNAGVQFAEAPQPTGDNLRGKVFVFTGKFTAINRKDATTKVESLGGAIVTSVTKKTTHLVVGAEPGSKLTKAKTLGTKIITEPQFQALIEA